MRRGIVALTLIALSVPALQAAPVVVRARAFDGRAWHDALEVEIAADGRIARAGAATSASALAPEGAVLTPGFLDLDARFGLSPRDSELEETVAPDLRIADGFAPDEAQAAAFRRSGVTTAWVCSGPDVVLGGACAVVSPQEAGRPPLVARAAWGASASLASAARIPDRAPTSLPDQSKLLRSTLSEHPVPGPVRVRFDDGASARAAAKAGLPVGVPRREDAAEMRGAPGLVASCTWTRAGSDILAPLVEGLGEAPLALGSWTSVAGPATVRLAACRLVEEGAPADLVLRALTSDAAALLGDPALGRLEAGARADLVLWSGDPLSLSSHPLVVWVSGKEVFRAP